MTNTTKDTHAKHSQGITMHTQAQHYCKIPVGELEVAMAELSSGALKTLLYYFNYSSGWIYDNYSIAQFLKVTQKRVVELRKELVDKGFLYIDNKGSIPVTLVGRGAVLKYRPK